MHQKLQLNKATVSNLESSDMNHVHGGSKPTFEAGCTTDCSMVPPGCVSFPTEEHSVCVCAVPVGG